MAQYILRFHPDFVKELGAAIAYYEEKSKKTYKSVQQKLSYVYENTY